MRGSHTSARARAMRCFCPPESCTPALADHGVELLRQALDLAEHVRLARGIADPVHRPRPSRGSSSEKPMLPRHRGREEEGVLLRVADGRAQRLERQVADVHASDADGPPRGRQQAREQHRERGLARPGAADDRERTPRWDVEAHVVEDRRARRNGTTGRSRRAPPAPAWRAAPSSRPRSRAWRRRSPECAPSSPGRAARWRARSPARSAATSCVRAPARRRRSRPVVIPPPPVRAGRASPPYQVKTRMLVALTAPAIGPIEPRSRASARLASR